VRIRMAKKKKLKRLLFLIFLQALKNTRKERTPKKVIAVLQFFCTFLSSRCQNKQHKKAASTKGVSS
jgi:hypothetical protein